MLSTLELFSGIGGQRLVLQAAGIAIVGACERDPAKRAIYSRHFGCPDWFPLELEGATLPRADLWCASGSPAMLAQVGMLRGPRPCALWLQTAPQACPIEGEHFRRAGRLHVMIGFPADSFADLADTLPLHKPTQCPTPELAEVAQGFPRGWTEGMAETSRYNALGASLSVTSQVPIAHRVVQLLTRQIARAHY